MKAYNFLYFGIAQESVNNLAYIFDYEFLPQHANKSFLGGFEKLVDRWRQEYPNSVLMLVTDGEQTKVLDTRAISKNVEFYIDKLELAIIEKCNEPAKRDNLMKSVESMGFDSIEVGRKIDKLIFLKLIIEIDDRIISLVTSTTAMSLKARVRYLQKKQGSAFSNFRQGNN